MKLKLLTLTSVLFLSTLSLHAQDQEAEKPGFQGLWERHQKGENVSGELRALLDAETASTVDRFNAGYLLAVTEIGRGDHVAALKDLDRIDELKSGSAQVAVRRAEALLIAKKIDEADKACDKAAKMSSRMNKSLASRCQIIMARIDGEKGQAKRGFERLKRLIKKDRKNWELHFFSGKLAETMDDPKAAIEAYELAIENLPEADPCPGIFALQRWSALVISSDKSSYGNPKLLGAAIDRYKEFLKRAEKNEVPEEIVTNVKNTIGTLEYFKGQK